MLDVRQKGYGTLAVLLVATALSVSWLLAVTPPEVLDGSGQAAATRALSRARVALDGYAASYADQHSSHGGLRSSAGVGPGFLPCPDIDADGSPDAACATNASGGLPWRRLGVAPLPVVYGGSLRYTLADAHRSNPRKFVPLNTDLSTYARLGRWSALLGVATVEQPDDRWLVQALHEPSPPFLQGARQGLSQDRLLLAAQSRAMRAVENALRRYRQAAWNPHRLYPWLRAPRSADDMPSVGVTRGHLAVHRVGNFGTSISFRAVIKSRNGESAAPVSVDFNGAGDCRWSVKLVFDCVAKGIERDGPHVGRSIQVAFSVIARHTDSFQVDPPGISQTRTRSLALDRTLEESETVTWSAEPGDQPPIRLVAGEHVTLEIGGIAYALAPGDEVEPWLLEHDWTSQILIGVSPSLGPARSGDCDIRGCLVVNGRLGRSQAEAVLVGSGPPLAGQRRGVAFGLPAYFEGENRFALGREFTAGAPAPAFNDTLVSIDASVRGFAE